MWHHDYDIEKYDRLTDRPSDWLTDHGLIFLELLFQLKTSFTCKIKKDARMANIISESQLILDWKFLIILKIRKKQIKDKYNCAPDIVFLDALASF